MLFLQIFFPAKTIRGSSRRVIIILKVIIDMIREANENDYKRIDEMQFELQKYFSEIDQSRESLPYRSINDAHRYMQKMIADAKNMNGKIFIDEKNDAIIGFIQGVIIEHKKGDDEIYDLSHNPSKEGWIGLLYVKPDYRGCGVGQELLDKMKDYFIAQGCTSIKLLVLSDNASAVDFYKKSGFVPHDLEMIMKIRVQS